MATIKGQNLRVMVGGKCIAMATSCQFHVAAQLESSATKDDANNWDSNEVVGLSWDAQTDALVTLTDNGSNGELVTDIFTAMLNSTLVTLKFDQTAGTNNRTAQNAAIAKTGSAYISDISITAQNRANSTMTVQFTGTGALS